MDLSFVAMYLAIAFIFNAIMLLITRQLKIADFIAHLLTGMVMGGLFLYLEGAGQLLLTPENNSSIDFLSNIGLLFFMIQLGFNFEWQFIKIYPHRLWGQLVFLLSLNVLVIGGIGSMFLFPEDTRSVTFLVISTWSINIGILLTANFPVNNRLKEPFTQLIQICVLSDILAIVVFSCLNLTIEGNSVFQNGLMTNLYSVLIVFIFALVILFPTRSRSMLSISNDWSLSPLPYLKIGILCLFVLAGLSLKLSPLLIGFMLGAVMRTILTVEPFEKVNRFFSVVSFLYLIPFVTIGQQLILSKPSFEAAWQTAFVLILGLIIISILYSIIAVRKTQDKLIFGMGMLPRGELMILMVGLAVQNGFMDKNILAAAVLMVILTTLIGRVLFIRPFSAYESGG